MRLQQPLSWQGINRVFFITRKTAWNALPCFFRMWKIKAHSRICFNRSKFHEKLAMRSLLFIVVDVSLHLMSSWFTSANCNTLCGIALNTGKQEKIRKRPNWMKTASETCSWRETRSTSDISYDKKPTLSNLPVSFPEGSYFFISAHIIGSDVLLVAYV